MMHEILESISQRIRRTEVEENRRIQEIANELYRRCCLYDGQFREGQGNARTTEVERHVTESYAKEFGLWIPMEHVFQLGSPGPCGNENDTYAFEGITYKVNNLLNSQGSVLKLFYKILLHNFVFTETAYTFYGFTGFHGSSIMPIFTQPLIANAIPATPIEISTYMAALGFYSTAIEGCFTNGEIEVWDVVARNVLKDNDGDIFVIDAELRLL